MVAAAIPWPTCARGMQAHGDALVGCWQMVGGGLQGRSALEGGWVGFAHRASDDRGGEQQRRADGQEGATRGQPGPVGGPWCERVTGGCLVSLAAGAVRRPALQGGRSGHPVREGAVDAHTDSARSGTWPYA